MKTENKSVDKEKDIEGESEWERERANIKSNYGHYCWKNYGPNKQSAVQTDTLTVTLDSESITQVLRWSDDDGNYKQARTATTTTNIICSYDIKQQ